MADLEAIHDGLATALDTISGLRICSVDKISPPAAVVGEVEIEFDLAMGRGLDEMTWRVRVYASRADDRSGLTKLNGYLAGSGSSSVKAALESDRTLGGVCQMLRVERVDGYGVYEVAGMQYLGAEFTVRVYASGS